MDVAARHRTVETVALRPTAASVGRHPMGVARRRLERPFHLAIARPAVTEWALGNCLLAACRWRVWQRKCCLS
jgi:hypothetical protein